MRSSTYANWKLVRLAQITSGPSHGKDPALALRNRGADRADVVVTHGTESCADAEQQLPNMSRRIAS